MKGSKPAAKTHCVPGASTAVACAGVGRSAPFRAALPVAIAAVEKARTELKKDAGKGTPTAATLAVVRRHFAKEANADKVRDKLRDIAAFLRALPAITRCHNECDPDCGSPAYWDPDTSKMVLCAGFLRFSNPGKAGLLMHEATHGVPSIQSDDLGYSSDRIIDFLDEAHAFKNTDSYTTLVMELSGIAGFVDAVPSDTFSGFGTRTVGGVPVNETDLIKRPLALAEKWCIWAYQDLQFVYGQIVKVIAGNTPVSAGDAREVMASLHDRFGLSEATQVPTTADQRAAAALQDRFERMAISTFNQPLMINKAAAADPTRFDAAKQKPQGGPFVVPGQVAIGDDFFAAGDDNARARFIVRALAHAMPDISLAREVSYGDFAFDRSKTAVRS